MTDPPTSGENSPYGDDLRTLMAAHLAGYQPDRARIRARLDAGLADARRSDAGRAARTWPKPPIRVAALAGASLVAAAAVLFAVIDTGRPVQVSTTGPASGQSVTDDDRGPSGDGADDDPVAAPRPSPDDSTDPTVDGQLLAAGTDVPGIRVPADTSGPTASTAVAGTDGAGNGVGGGPGAAAGSGGGSGGAGGSPSSTSPPGGGDGGPGVIDTPGGATTTTAAPAAPTTRSTSTTAAPSTTIRSTTMIPAAGPTVQIGLLPRQVVLGPTGYLDWVVVGSRNDGKAVRMKAGTGRLTVSAPTGALPTNGVIPILWSGGSPEQDRTDNTRWWTANASPSSFTVQVAGADNASEVVLYAGSSTSLTVTVTVSGRGVTQKAVSAGFFGSAGQITVSLSGADRGRDVTITLGAAKGTVSLGAVTER